MIRVRGILQSMTYDGRAVTVRRGLRTDVIPLAQIASVQRDPARCRLTVIDTGGHHHGIIYWTVTGAAARLQRKVSEGRRIHMRFNTTQWRVDR